MYVWKLKPHFTNEYVFNPVTYHFPNNGSVEVAIDGPTSFYVSAQGGYDDSTVLNAKTVDVAADHIQTKIALTIGRFIF